MDLSLESGATPGITPLAPVATVSLAAAKLLRAYDEHRTLFISQRGTLDTPSEQEILRWAEHQMNSTDNEGKPGEICRQYASICGLLEGFRREVCGIGELDHDAKRWWMLSSEQELLTRLHVFGAFEANGHRNSRSQVSFPAEAAPDQHMTDDHIMELMGLARGNGGGISPARSPAEHAVRGRGDAASPNTSRKPSERSFLRVSIADISSPILPRPSRGPSILGESPTSFANSPRTISHTRTSLQASTRYSVADLYPHPPASKGDNYRRESFFPPPTLSRNTSSVESLSVMMTSVKQIQMLQGTLTRSEYGFELIADFEVVAELGRGNFGTVSLAVDADGKMFAIKTLHNGTQLATRSPRMAKPKQHWSGGRKSFEAGPEGKRADPLSPATPQANTGERHLPTGTKGSSDGTGGGSSSQTGSGSSGEGESSAEREIAVMKRLNHPNVVKLHAVIEDATQNKTHLVMQYIENGPPTRMLSDGTCKPLPIPLALRYMSQVSSGLDYLHRCGIIHRDIKPENILIDREHNAYVSDFGVSSLLTDKRGISKRVGTLAFMSPELIASSSAVVEFGKQSDVWAFGVTLYCLVYGRLPFDGRTAADLIRAIAVEPLSFPKSSPEPSESSRNIASALLCETSMHLKDPSYERGIRVILGKLLEKDPSSRLSLKAFRKDPFVHQFSHAATPQVASLRQSAAQLPPTASVSKGEGESVVTLLDPPVFAEMSQPPSSGLLGADLEAMQKASMSQEPAVHVTKEDVEAAICRCAVAFTQRRNSTSVEAQQTVAKFVDKFRHRIRSRRASEQSVQNVPQAKLGMSFSLKSEDGEQAPSLNGSARATADGGEKEQGDEQHSS
jgi:serine/threonine protein kinase